MHVYQANANLDKIKSVLNEIQRRKLTKKDFIYPASKLVMHDDGKILLTETKTFQVGDRIYTDWQQAEQAADETGEKLVPLGVQGAMPLSRTAERQLATRLDIPLRYIDKLRESENKDLAAYNFTTLLQRTKDRFLVRTLDGNIRAILSDRYRLLDNHDVFFAAADILQSANADVWNARLWDDGFELFAVSKDISGEVRHQHGDGSKHAWAELEGKPDLHNAAVRISNSETGCGGMNVWLAALRRVCNNGCMIDKGLSVVHLGKRNETEGIVWSDETRIAEDKTIWLKLRDTIRTAFDRKKFDLYLARMNRLTEEKLENHTEAVENVVTEYQLGEERKASILQALFESRDTSRYGLVQAITVQTHDATDEEASRLEEVAAQYAGV